MFDSPTTAVPEPGGEPIATAASRKDRTTRHFNGRDALNPHPAVRHLKFGNAVAARVELSGLLGKSRAMLLDEDVWADLKWRGVTAWGLVSNGRGRWYVSSSSQIAREAQEDARVQRVSLSRLITGAKRGEVVVYLNGNPLDLRRRNLRVLPKAEARAFKIEAAARHEAQEV